MEKQVLDSPFTKKEFLNLVKQFNDDQDTIFEDFAISEKTIVNIGNRDFVDYRPTSEISNNILKNNSISNVKASIEYEIKRQAKLLDAGESVIQETRRWDASKNSSFSLRSKEEAHDYRYFPDPDLMPVSMDRNIVQLLKEALPERPFDRQRRYQEKYSLPYTITSVLCADRELSDFFESALKNRLRNNQFIYSAEYNKSSFENEILNLLRELY